MPIAAFRTYMGIAKQPVPGTPTVATDFIALTSDPKPVDVITQLDDKAYRGSAVMTYNKVQGQRKSSLSLDGNLDMTTIGYPLQGLLPDLVVTGAATPFSTAFSTKNAGTTQAVPYTFSDYNGLETRQYSDAKYEELTIGFTGDGLVTFKSKIQCWASVVAGSNPTPSFNTAPPLAAYVGVVTIGGAGALNVMSGEITIKRAIDVQQTVSGIQDPYNIWQGPIMVAGKLDFVYESNLEFNRYLTNNQVPLDIKFTQGTTSLQLHSSVTAFETGAVSRGKTFNELGTTFECLGTITDAGASLGYSPLKVTLVNSKASGTYA